MKKTLCIILISLLFFTMSCKKEQVVVEKISNGTYEGKRFFQSYTAIGFYTDTISLILDAPKYSFHSSSILSFGNGIFKLNNDTITFTDQLFRIDMYTWYSILQGAYKFRIYGDSLFLEQQNPQGEVVCKLKKNR